MAHELAAAVHRVLDSEGNVVGQVPDLPPERLVQLHRWMLTGRIFSERMIALQRQGRMGTFGDLSGQEAASVGLAAPLRPQDWLIASYRELLSYYVKGTPLIGIMDLYRGRVTDRYPRDARCLPIQIILATQMLHAAGAAMAAKLRGEDAVVMGVCGDGATSEGDFAEALNFAGTFKAPAIFAVQNNGWAISVPRSHQTAAEYIAHRGPGYGMPGVLVDGNDVLAVCSVVQAAMDRARAGEGPTLIEVLTYRMGAHTTADDPKRYRPPEEAEHWRQHDPIARYRRFLTDQGLLTPEAEDRMKEAVAEEVAAAVAELDAEPREDPLRIFDMVYAEPTPQLRAQKELLRRDMEGE